MQELVEIDDIDGGFAATPVDGIAAVELDGEVVLGLRRGETLQTFCLNRTGGIVWSCFDGDATLDELIDDLSDAFGTPRMVVAEDVLGLTRQLGTIGLLAGVRPLVIEQAGPQGLDIGSELPPADLVDMDGISASLESFRGRQMFLVNWSPFCGFCDRIGADLASVQDDLRRGGVELVLLAIGEAEPNRQLLVRHGLDCVVLLQQGNVPAFFGVGTPSAYVIDEDGKVASSLAVGSDRVPVLAKELATNSKAGPAAS